MIGADVERPHADTCRNADAGNGKHEPERRSRTEGFDLGIDGLQLGLVGFYDRIDLGLEGLSVRAVGFIVALGVGGCRSDFSAETGRFGAEGAEFLGALDELSETFLLALGNEQASIRR